MTPRDLTVLVVEDNQDHAFFIRLAAERAFSGIDVRMASDGRKGIAYLAGTAPYQDRDEHPFPDFVILDLIMPHVDGFGVLKWVGTQPDLSELPVVVLTSSLNPGDEERALAMGARAFHTKPVDLVDLAGIVQTIVERHVR